MVNFSKHQHKDRQYAYEKLQGPATSIADAFIIF
jgi:hypothetical protein